MSIDEKPTSDSVEEPRNLSGEDQQDKSPEQINVEIPLNEYKVTLNLQARTPVVTYVLIGVTILIYLLQTLSQMVLEGDVLLVAGAMLTDKIYQGQFWRLITPIFLHLSIIHIGFNMWMLYVLGRNLELYYGHVRFLQLYLISAFCGNVLFFLVSTGGAVGAATGLFGLLIAQAVLVLKNWAAFGDRARGMLTQILLVTAINLGIGLIPGFNLASGLGGVLGGLAFAWFAGPVWGVRAGLFELDIRDVRTDATGWRVLFIEVIILSGLVLQRLILK